jgi:transposase
LRYAWRRCRRSLKSRRDPTAFAREAENQQALQHLADHGRINLYYFDESGFATVPSIPYAWQPLGIPLELPSFPSNCMTILGFLPRDQPSFFQAVEGTVGTTQAIAAFDRCAADYARHGQPCVVTLDNAPWHTRRDFRARVDRWGAQGVILHYLPPYSPELNLIEILWRKLKYDWLPLSCYTSYDNLKNAVLAVLSGVGSKYQISLCDYLNV